MLLCCLTLSGRSGVQIPKLAVVPKTLQLEVVAACCLLLAACCLLGTPYEVRTTKYNWLVWCQYNVTGWGTMWAYDMISQWGSTIKKGIGLHCYKESLHLLDLITVPMA